MEYTNEIKSENAERSHGRQSVVLIALTVAMAIGLGAAGVLYASANERVTKLEAEKKALIESSNGENKAKPDIVNPNAPEEQGEYIVMKDWGIKIKLSQELKGLGYEVHNTGDFRRIYFTLVTKEMERISPTCYKSYLKVLNEQGVKSSPGVAIGAYTKTEVENSERLRDRKAVFENEKYKFFASHGHYVLCQDQAGKEAEGKVISALDEVLKKAISNL